MASKQMTWWLLREQEPLEEVCSGLPPDKRPRLVSRYARLIAMAARTATPRACATKEPRRAHQAGATADRKPDAKRAGGSDDHSER